MQQVRTYYDILDVDAESSQDEIKRAFRRKAKELHPDVNGQRSTSTAEMRALLKAYETLGNPERRSVYDRTHFIVPRRCRFDYREFLRSRSYDMESQSKLIFFDLLHSRESDAVELYDRLRCNHEFDLSKHLDREDFMDCAYLLAEVYENRGEYLQAYRLLKSIVQLENERPYFRHFIEEVIEKLKTITCFKMVGVESWDVVLECLEELVAFDFSRKDTAFFLKKAAEIYSEQNDHDTAVRYLRRGLSLDEKMTGIKKLKQKIGFAE